MKLYFIINSMIDWAHLNGQKTGVETLQEFGFCITEHAAQSALLLRHASVAAAECSPRIRTVTIISSYFISVSFCLP